MSGIDLTIPWKGSQYLAGELPLQQARTRLTEAQVPLTEAQAQETLAHADYYRPLGAKAQVEAEQARLMLDATKGMIQGIGRPASNQAMPPAAPATGSGYTPQYSPAPAGGGGRPINPGGGTPNPEQPGSQRLAYLSTTPPFRPPPGVTGSVTMADMTRPITPGGTFARVDAAPDDGSIFLGGTTAEAVPPGQVGGAPAPAGSPVGIPPPMAVPPGWSTPGAGPGSQQLAGQAPQYTQGSERGVFIPEIGMVPQQLAQSYGMLMLQKGPVAAAAEIKAQRSNRLLELAYGGRTPEEWARNVDYAWREGYVSTEEYSKLRNNPQLRDGVIRAHQPPERTAQQDAEQRQKGNVWDYQRNGYYPDVRQHSTEAPAQTGVKPGPNGTMVPDLTTPVDRSRRAGVEPGGQDGAPAAAPAAPGQRTTQRPPTGNAFDDYAANLKDRENPGGDPSTRNPTTGASGDYQWMPSRNGRPGTKATIARQALPDVTRGMTNEQIDAHTFTPEQERRMLQTFTANNAETLLKSGQRPSGAALYLSHYLGPNGVLELRKHRSDEVLADIPAFKAAVASNPELGGGTTVGHLIDFAKQKFGNETITADHIAKAGSPAATPGATTPAATPAAPAYQGKPEKAAGVDEITTTYVKGDAAAVEGANQAATQAATPMRIINSMRDKVPNLEAGSLGERRTEAMNFIKTVFGDSPAATKLLEKVTGWDFSKLSDRQAFIKESIQLSIAQEAAMPGVRSGIGLTELLGKGTPNINMDKDTIKELLNWMLVGHQHTRDYADGLSSHVSGAYDKYMQDPHNQNYTPAKREYDAAWNNGEGIHAPLVYQGSADLLNGRADWNKRLNYEQQKEAIRIARRADPAWTPAPRAK